MDCMFGYESHSDRFTKGGYISEENQCDVYEKDTGGKKSEEWGNCFSVVEVSWRCVFCMVFIDLMRAHAEACLIKLVSLSYDI